MKSFLLPTEYAQIHVALFTRAWIEILDYLYTALLRRSPSSRGRGLKFSPRSKPPILPASPSSRGRGLKYYVHGYLCHLQGVALFTRAWIEIAVILMLIALCSVALFTRAWIEICRFFNRCISCSVALFTRAWIEMIAGDVNCNTNRGRPLHEGVD